MTTSLGVGERRSDDKVIERHAPDARAKMQAGVALTDLAPRFDKAISGVRASFYNPALAAKAKLRVQL